MLRHPSRLLSHAARADAQVEDKPNQSDVEEVGAWDVSRDVVRESMVGAKRQGYRWMAALLAGAGLIFAVLALAHAPGPAYWALLGVFVLGTLTGTARR